MTKQDENEQIIETLDEEGNVVKFELIDIVEVDEVEYGLLLPIDEFNEKDDDSEVVLMRLKKEGDEFVFEAIEDDDEFNKIVELIQNMDEEDEDAEDAE
ncbi:MAG: DUF1292 domain-containing protein [Candidatus Gastranaerophilales bacterium]|nr:DUF1292 domain-containing protein [Candidatus Gastranaerophilales bacterium]